ncbi:hypothetical protein FKM82_031051 [Ascaphus truei]
MTSGFITRGLHAIAERRTQAPVTLHVRMCAFNPSRFLLDLKRHADTPRHLVVPTCDKATQQHCIRIQETLSSRAQPQVISGHLKKTTGPVLSSPGEICTLQPDSCWILLICSPPRPMTGGGDDKV